MPKVMVWNYKKEKYELATETEADALLSLVESNARSIARPCPACGGIGEKKFLGIVLRCSTCHGTGRAKTAARRKA